MAIEETAEAIKNSPTVPGPGVSVVSNPEEWPPDEKRLRKYRYHELLFDGDHYNAFDKKIDDPRFSTAYNKIRWVQVNFAGLISRICADMLFGERITLKMPEDGDEEFVNEVWSENSMDAQIYESALQNSFRGDAVFKLRLELQPGSKNKYKLIIEDTNPKVFFPVYNSYNTRGEPDKIVLGWELKIAGSKKEYIQKEIHEKGKITNEIWELENQKLIRKIDWEEVYPDEEEVVETKIDEFMVVHIPNWRTSTSPFGYSDYNDLDSLFFAINNRMSKIDNILDTHSDPFLMVPEGVIDENGKVKKDGRVIEVRDGENGKPEYIVWDASLENAFKEVEKLIEMVMMIGEVSPDALGFGKGMSDSGRALKYKLLRLLAKINRKKLYYHIGIQKVLLVAQKLAEKWSIEVNGITFKGKPVKPDIDWADGLPNNYDEQVKTEVEAISGQITSMKRAIQRVYGIDEQEAETILKEIEEEQPTIEMPVMSNNPDLPDTQYSTK